MLNSRFQHEGRIKLAEHQSRVTRRQFLVKAASAAIALGGTATLAACGTAAPAAAPTTAPAAATKQKLKLRVATFVAEEYIATRTARVFADLVNKKSSGDITAEVFPAAQLGGEKDIAEGVRLGTIDVGYNAGVIAQWVPKWDVSQLPFLYRDYNHAVKALQGPILETLHPLVNTAGFHIIGLGPNAPRQTISRKPLKTLADWKGLKIRVPEVPLFVDTFKALGATPTPIPAPEIYSAMQTGIVDAQEGAPDWMHGLKTYEIVKNLMLTAHILNSEMFIVGEAWWRRQSADVQKVIGEAGAESWQYYTTERDKEGQAGIKKLQEAGMTIVEVDRTELAKAVESVHEKFAKDQGVGDLVKKIKDQK